MPKENSKKKENPFGAKAYTYGRMYGTYGSISKGITDWDGMLRDYQKSSWFRNSIKPEFLSMPSVPKVQYIDIYDLNDIRHITEILDRANISYEMYENPLSLRGICTVTFSTGNGTAVAIEADIIRLISVTIVDHNGDKSKITL